MSPKIRNKSHFCTSGSIVLNSVGFWLIIALIGNVVMLKLCNHGVVYCLHLAFVLVMIVFRLKDS